MGREGSAARARPDPELRGDVEHALVGKHLLQSDRQHPAFDKDHRRVREVLPVGEGLMVGELQVNLLPIGVRA